MEGSSSQTQTVRSDRRLTKIQALGPPRGEELEIDKAASLLLRLRLECSIVAKNEVSPPTCHIDLPHSGQILQADPKKY